MKLPRWRQRLIQASRYRGETTLEIVDVDGWRWLITSTVMLGCALLRHPCGWSVRAHQLIDWAGALPEANREIVVEVPITRDQAEALFPGPFHSHDAEDDDAAGATDDTAP